MKWNIQLKKDGLVRIRGYHKRLLISSYRLSLSSIHAQKRKRKRGGERRGEEGLP